MTIHFGNDFDGHVYHSQEAANIGVLFAGPNKLLLWLEEQLGLSGYPINSDFLRIELYRQSLGQFSDTFYGQSFEADRFATAEFLLGWRDELLLAGWTFELFDQMPARLRTLAEVEVLFRKKILNASLSASAFGYADRFEQVLHRMKQLPVPIKKLLLYEPEHLQKPHIQRLLALLKHSKPHQSIETVEPPHPDFAPNIDIVCLHGRRDSDAATFIAQLLRDNQPLKPTFLAPQPSLALEQSLISEGFSAMGIQSASLARPSLQVLKLAPAFIWEPVDVYKIMEFLTLPNIPLDPELASEIARIMAEKPGFFSDNWFAAVFGYLEKAEVPEESRRQYNFWFDRKRYPIDKSAPKRDAMMLYFFLQEWAKSHFEETGGTNHSLLAMAEQARRIHALLEELPEQRITFLELERIVRTIFEASSVQLAPAEKGSFDFFHKPGAIAAPIDTLIWWNFIEQNETPPPDKWRKEERQWLEEQAVFVQSPRVQSQLIQLLQRRPFQWTNKRLIVVVPEQVDGAEVQPSLLMPDLEASLGAKFGATVFNLNKKQDLDRLASKLRIPARQLLSTRNDQLPRTHLQLTEPSYVTPSEYETPTNLESLFYYPHRWFFRQKLRLFPPYLLRISGETTLLGNLSHRFFEKILQENISEHTRETVHQWVNNQAEILLPREGATLLMYGMEQERTAFLNRVKNAAWSLVTIIHSNGWTVAQTEKVLQGFIGAMPVRGKADLVLTRGNEQAIVDLKWGGSRWRKELIVNGEDLQLVLYAKMLSETDIWPHTAYFVLEDGKIVARNNNAFREATVSGNSAEHGAACDAIFDKMGKTHAWRMSQIENGMVELRTTRTAPALEALYEGQLFDLLEMKTEDARWDDYRTLIEVVTG